MHTLFHKFKLAIKPQLTTENGVLIVALLIAASFLWNTMGALQRNYQLQRQVDIMEQEAALYELENQTLEFQKKYYQSAEYIELSARQRLNKAAPGEKVIILPPSQEKPAQTPTAALTNKSETNFEQWIRFFFGGQSNKPT